MEEYKSRDEKRIDSVEQAPEIPFEDVEKMVDMVLARPPAREFNFPVSLFCTAAVGGRSNRNLCRRVSQPDGWMLWK